MARRVTQEGSRPCCAALLRTRGSSSASRVPTLIEKGFSGEPCAEHSVLQTCSEYSALSVPPSRQCDLLQCKAYSTSQMLRTVLTPESQCMICSADCYLHTVVVIMEAVQQNSHAESLVSHSTKGENVSVICLTGLPAAAKA